MAVLAKSLVEFAEGNSQIVSTLVECTLKKKKVWINIALFFFLNVLPWNPGKYNMLRYWLYNINLPQILLIKYVNIFWGGLLTNGVATP